MDLVYKFVLCTLELYTFLNFFSGRIRNVILFRIYQYLISHLKKIESDLDFV